MTKVFISQPMVDKTNEEIEKEREVAKERIKEIYGEDFEIIDSFFKDAPHDAKPLWFLGESLKKLSEADIVFFEDGWENARGCKIEHECASAYGLSIIHD